jgi:hypothetical protein
MLDGDDSEIERVDSGSSVGPCPQRDTSSIDTADSCLVSLSSQNSSCLALQFLLFDAKQEEEEMISDEHRRMSTLTSLSCPCRRKKDLHETQERTLKLLPRAVSPQTKQRNGRLGSRPAVSFFRPMVVLHKVKESSCSSSAAARSFVRSLLLLCWLCV